MNANQYIFTKSDLIAQNLIKNDKQVENWLYQQTKAGKIKRIRSGLYLLLDQLGNYQINKFEIASKITADSYIAYHSALEYYGLANQVIYIVQFATKNRVRSFQFDDLEYDCIINDNDIEIVEDVITGVRVTSLERTIVDCIDKIDLSGGIEEILNAIEQLSFLDEQKLIKTLESYNKVFLYQKVGFLLEYFNENLHLSEPFFNYCKSKLTNQVKYFGCNSTNEKKYYSDWKLVAPINLLKIIYGVIE